MTPLQNVYVKKKKKKKKKRKKSKLVISDNFPTIPDENYNVGISKEVRMSIKPRSQSRRDFLRHEHT